MLPEIPFSVLILRRPFAAACLHYGKQQRQDEGKRDRDLTLADQTPGR